MGLKVRRLKGGFAYYGEYKFGDGDGGQHCIYERVDAGSMRDARRIYAARRNELQQQLSSGRAKPLPRGRTPTKPAAGDKAYPLAAALLRVLSARNVVSNRRLRELFVRAFAETEGTTRNAAAKRARKFIQQHTLSMSEDAPLVSDGCSLIPFPKIDDGMSTEVSAEFAGELGDVRSYRVRLVPG